MLGMPQSEDSKRTYSMIIFTAVMHKNSFYIHADTRKEFWVVLSKKLGWGKFELIRPSDEFSPTGGLFELVEVRSADSEPPESVTVGSNVLWRLPEALGVLKSIPSSDLQVYLRHGLYPQGQQSCHCVTERFEL